MVRAAQPSLPLTSALLVGTILTCAPAGCQRFASLLSNKDFSRQPALSQVAPWRPQSPSTPKLSKKEQTEAKFALARSVEKANELEQAANAYEDVIKSDGKHSAAHHRLAVVCDKQGKFDQAEQHYRLALQHDPENAELLCDFGYSLYVRGQWPEAEAQLRQALRYAPQMARDHNNLGLIEARTGRIEEAIRSFQAAGCTPSKARANVAFALMLDQRWLEAQQQLQMALSLDPNSTVIRKRMDELQAVLARISTPEPNVIPTSHSAQDNRG